MTRLRARTKARGASALGLAAVPLLAFACDDDSGASACLPGEQRACPCAGYTSAIQGVRVCLAEGTGLGPCTGCPEARDATVDQDLPSDASDASVHPCAPAADASGASLCLTFAPEAMEFVSTDARRDGKGRLSVMVYDATQGPPDSGTAPIATISVPESNSEDERDIRALEPIRFDNLPAKVGVFAFFADQPALPTDRLSPFVWVGGVDLSRGVEPSFTLHMLELTLAAGNVHEIRLTALRRLVVSIDLCQCVTPLDDAAGPLTWLATPAPVTDPNPVVSGMGKLSCGRAAVGAPLEVEGFVVGRGPHYIFAQLDDYGVSTSSFTAAPGGLVTFPEPPSIHRVVLPESAYEGRHSSLLSFRLPLGDAGVLPPRRCP